MRKKPLQPQSTLKRRQAAHFRKKNEKVQLLFNQEREQSPLFCTLDLVKEADEAKRNGIQVISEALHDDQDFFLPKTNRIYNNSNKPKNNQSIKSGSRLLNPRNSLKNLIKEEQINFAEQRPQTSQCGNSKQVSQIFRSNKDVLNSQNRPGSSKSSRIFKRKGPFDNDQINSENEEGDEFEDRHELGNTRIEASRIMDKNKISAGGQRGRIGTSLPQGKRVFEKIPPKIDPVFFRLFAQ